MKFPPAPSLKPLDLARTPRASTRPLREGDLSSAARLTKPAQTQHDRVVAQTQKWVAQTFFGTLMKQMEEGPFKSDLFSGGRGGQAFSSLYHQQLTERMARAAGGKLVNTIVRRIEANQKKTSDLRTPRSEKSDDRPSNPRQTYRGAQKRTTHHHTLDIVS
jgi:Rod binding domain-containing protein